MVEYIFVHLIDKKPVGSNVGSSIPLHMTILSWFEVNLTEAALIKIVEGQLSSATPAITKASEVALFGPSNDIPVTQMTRTPELVRLHTTLLDLMRQNGAQFDMNWNGPDNWNPHVSDKPNMKLPAGSEIIVDDIDLVFRTDKNSDRTLLHRFNLGSL